VTVAHSAFRLSRIQAEGWNAARRLPLLGREKFSAEKMESLNPYSAGPARSRWAEGFMSALAAERD
jgi:hypothetical protein